MSGIMDEMGWEGRASDPHATTVYAPASGVRPAVVAESVVGDLFGDRFEVVSVLGRGGLGVVYEVRDRETGAKRALKTLRAPSLRRLRHIKTEYRAVRDLTHPNLVQMHELFVEGERGFVTMDYVDGVHLARAAREAVREEGWTAVREMLAQCARGLQALHAHGYLHRDLKPSNVLVAEGRVVIVDFGLANVPGTAAGGAGTPRYMAPEQKGGEPLTPAADWFSFGRLITEVVLRGSGSAQGRDDPVRASLLRLADALQDPVPACRPDWPRVRDTLSGTSQAPRPAFVGRQAELDVLRRAFADARAGDPQLVWLTGAPGIGKSALVRRFLQEPALRAQATVLRGACSPDEHIPFNAFDGVVEGLIERPAHAGALRRLPAHKRELVRRLFPAAIAAATDEHDEAPALEAALPAARQAACLRAVVDLIHAVATDRPLVVWIDDLQWADADSLDLLRTWCEAPQPEAHARRVLFVASLRGHDAAPVEAALEGASWWTRTTIAMGALGAEEARDLALGWNPLAAEGAAQVARASGGNPVLIEQLARLAVVDAEDLDVDRAIERRAATLPAGDRALLARLAAHPRPLPRAVARRLERATGGSLRRLCSERFCHFTRGADEVDVYHARIREDVLRSLDAATRAHCHRGLVEAFASIDAVAPGLMAEHAHRAGLHDQAFDYAERAAREARRSLAFRKAAHWWKLCLMLPRAATHRPTELRVRGELAVVLGEAGRGRDAAAQHFAIARRSHASVGTRHRLHGAEQLLISGYLDEGFAELGAVLAGMGIRIPERDGAVAASLMVARLRVRMVERWPRTCDMRLHDRVDALAAATAGYMTSDPLRGAWFAAHQLEAARRCGDPTRLVRALVNEALYQAASGVVHAAAVDALTNEARLLSQTGGPESVSLVKLASGVGSVMLGRWSRAATELEEVEHLLTRKGARAVWALRMGRKFLTLAMWLTGRVDILERNLARWLDDARRRGDVLAIGTYSRKLPLLALLHDRPQEAAEHAKRRLATRRHGGVDEVHTITLHARTRLALYEDASAAKLLAIADDYPRLLRSLMARTELVRVMSKHYLAQLLAAAARKHREPTSIHERARRLERELREEGVAYARHYADLIDAALSAQRGDRDRSVRVLGRVSDALARDGQALYAAAASWQLGRLQGGAEGTARVAREEAWMRSVGVAVPERAVRFLCGGFPT